jgi:hypothetical protein
MDETGGHCVKRNKANIERQEEHVLSHMWKLRQVDPKVE